jgi:IS1 family transposase
LSWKVAWERPQALSQSMVDEASKAKQYHSDSFDAYASLWYHFGHYTGSEGRTDTYSVEGDHAELHQYLAQSHRDALTSFSERGNSL